MPTPKPNPPAETEPVETEPVESEPVETEPSETEPTDDEEQLPQTGLIHWPIPVLIVVGMIFIVVGVYLRTAEKKKYEE